MIEIIKTETDSRYSQNKVAVNVVHQFNPTDIGRILAYAVDIYGIDCEYYFRKDAGADWQRFRIVHTDSETLAEYADGEYMVSIDGGIAPSATHKTYGQALDEAKRLLSRINSPATARVMKVVKVLNSRKVIE